MIKYLDLTKLFIRSLRINKHNRTKGKFFFYSFITLTVLFVFIPVLFIYTTFIINTMTKLNEVDFAPFGFEALLFVISAFSFVFGFNVLINELYFSENDKKMLNNLKKVVSTRQAMQNAYAEMLKQKKRR